jgi:hypothetical protein
MAEPESVVLDVLKELRGEMRIMRQEMRDGFDRIDTLEIKLDGLTHAMVSGFGAIVHELKDLNQRVTLLEAERA